MTFGKGKPPKDRFFLAYICFVLHGIGFLLPWNVFINAREYFVDYKLNTKSSATSDYRINFLSYIAIGAQLPNLLMGAWNTFFQSKSSASNPTIRFLIVMSLEFVILLFTTILVFVDTSQVPALFFGLTMVSVVLINCCVGIHQTLTFGLAAYLPMRYSNAVIIGSNTCGVFVASVNMIAKGISQLWGKTEKSIIIATTSYFSVGTLYVVICIASYLLMQRLEFVRYYLDFASSADGKDDEEGDLISKTHEKRDSIPISDEDADNSSTKPTVSKFVESASFDNEERGDNKEGKAQGDIKDDSSKTTTLRNCFAVCCYSKAEGRVKCTEYWGRYVETFKECWVQCLTVWMVFTCTLSVFPAIQATVRPISPDYFIPENWFADVTCYFFFNLFAMLGCVVSSWVKFPGPRFLWIPVLIRMVIFIPYFMVSNYLPTGPGGRRMPLWVKNDHVYVVGSVVFAFTNGYFSSLAMMYAPSKSPPERAGLAGLLASFFLILGVFCGCYITRGLVALL
uniref:Equilibrative nucleoside transporter 1 n=3 Tax=Mesocestoides corti TaxID=53468 RepID=A0A5K3F9A7_MESCO